MSPWVKLPVCVIARARSGAGATIGETVPWTMKSGAGVAGHVEDIPGAGGTGAAPVDDPEGDVSARADVLQGGEAGKVNRRERTATGGVRRVRQRGDVAERAGADLVLEQTVGRAGGGVPVVKPADGGKGDHVTRAGGDREGGETVAGNGGGREDVFVQVLPPQARAAQEPLVPTPDPRVSPTMVKRLSLVVGARGEGPKLLGRRAARSRPSPPGL